MLDGVLYLVLLLLLAALALLVTALVTASTAWAWFSIAVSVIAGVLLIVDWALRRRRRAVLDEADSATVAPGAEARPEGDTDSDTVTVAVATPTAGVAADRADPAEPDTPARRTETAQQSGPREPSKEPAEEDTDAADVLIVSELADEVRVIDEHPRYHLSGCRWLQGQPTLPLPAREARELGFTPCALCTPDAVLAAKHRATRS